MSVFIPRDSNRLSKRFEGVVSDNEINSDSENEEEIKSEIVEEDEVLSESWTKTDYDSLVEQLRGTLPKKDTKKFKSQLQTVNWDSIVIRHHGPEETRRVAESLIAKVRSFRTLGDVLNDVPAVVAKMLGGDKPKAPLSAYNLFTRDNLTRLREENPEMKSKDIFRVASKAFHELSAKKKRKYEDTAAQLKAEYQSVLAKYYAEHPDRAPKKTPRRAKGTSRLRLERKKNPFNLFYESRLKNETNITLQQARKEWEELPVKSKLKFIRKSFEAHDAEYLLTKKEQEILARYHGKPDYIGRNVYEYYKRQNRHKYESMPSVGNEREMKLCEDYKSLSDLEVLQLRADYLSAKEKYIAEYQAYIKNLPEHKRKVEIEQLQKLMVKKEPSNSKKHTTPKEDELYPGSVDEDPPAAESTTIKKTSKVKKTKQGTPSFVKEEEDDDITPGQPSPSKKAKRGPSPSKKSAPVDSTPTVSKAKKKLVESSGDDLSSTETASTSKNGRGAPENEPTPAKKRPSPAKSPPPVVEKKRANKGIKVEPEAVTPPPAPKEPERPPTRRNIRKRLR